MDAAIETMKEEYGITDEELIKKVAAELLDVSFECLCFLHLFFPCLDAVKLGKT